MTHENADKLGELKTLEAAAIQFRDERDWKQFHKPKDLALSLSLEANEVMEHFQWRSDEECLSHIKEHKEDVADEMADVMNYLLIMAHDFDIDLYKATLRKIAKNAKKYPADKARGNHKKYKEL